MPNREVDTRTPPRRASTHLMDPTACDLKKPILISVGHQGFDRPDLLVVCYSPLQYVCSRSSARGQAEKSFKHGEHFASGADVVVIGSYESESEGTEQILAWH